jgi:hypothetical protein
MATSLTSKTRTSRLPRLWTYYVAIAVDIILLYVLNNLIYMNISGLNSDRFISCLWAINLALTAGIIGNFVLLLYRPLWYYHFTQMILNFLLILAFFVVYRWFPFNIDSDSAQRIVNIVLILIMMGTGIGALVELVKFVIAFFIREKPTIHPAVPLTLEAPQDTILLSPSSALPVGIPDFTPEGPTQAKSSESQKPVEVPPSSGSTTPETGTAIQQERPASQPAIMPPEVTPPTSPESSSLQPPPAAPQEGPVQNTSFKKS